MTQLFQFHTLKFELTGNAYLLITNTHRILNVIIVTNKKFMHRPRLISQSGATPRAKTSGKLQQGWKTKEMSQDHIHLQWRKTFRTDQNQHYQACAITLSSCVTPRSTHSHTP